MPAVGFAALDFAAFHQRDLPRRIAAGHGALAAPAAERLGSLAFRLPDGAAWTYRPTANGVALEAGDGADTVIALDHDAWEGLAHDYESAPGLLYAGRVRCLRGDAMQFVGWEPALRALYHGRPCHDPRAPLVDGAGRPLDPDRRFAACDDLAEMAEFLRTAGFVVVRGLFGADEIARFVAEARELAAEARKGDKLSWWAKTARGEEVLCRVTRAIEKPHLATLFGDERLARIVRAAEPSLEPRVGEGSGVAVIYKNPGVAEGLSDLPWHRDCGMGGHAILCPVVICSVYLTRADRETGELAFLPGSHRTSLGYLDARSAPPGAVRCEAAPGDVTIHYGDVMHAAPPPSRDDLPAYRISAITGWTRPGARPHTGAGSYNDVLHQRADGQVEHLSRVAERSGAHDPKP